MRACLELIEDTLVQRFHHATPALVNGVGLPHKRALGEGTRVRMSTQCYPLGAMSVPPGTW